MRYFALARDGELYDLCDCGDILAAVESADDLDIEVVWIADEAVAERWYLRLKGYFATKSLSDQVTGQPCKECGRTDLPLHVDYKCPDHSKYSC